MVQLTLIMLMNGYTLDEDNSLKKKSKIVNFCGFLKSPKDEAAYFNHERTTTGDFIRYIILTIGIIFFSLSIYDYAYNKNQTDFERSFIIRCLVLAIAVVYVFLLKVANRQNLYYFLLSVFPLMVSAAFIAILAFQKAQGLPYQSMAIMLIMFSSIFLPTPWISQLICNLLIMTVFVIISWTYIENPNLYDYSEIIIYFIITIIFTTIVQRKETITQRIKFVREKELEVLSTTDGLTGCYNRMWFDKKLAEISQLKKTDPNSLFTLVMFDIDNFKRINDTHGHIIGDKTLVECAALVKANIRSSDIFARWGGEEFVILLPSTPISVGYDTAERIRGIIEEHTFCAVTNITCSFGVVAGKPGERPEALVLRADNSLYRAKTGGKNRVEK